MSCCCNNSYSGLPCCCPANYSTTTTTTCPFGICCDPSCNNGEICQEVYSSNCAVYSGPEIVAECFTIQSGMRLTDILETVMTYVCPIIPPPAGPLMFDNITTNGSITSINLGLPYTITLGSLPVNFGQTLIGLHSGIAELAPIIISTNGGAGSINMYVNDILVNCITIASGVQTNEFPSIVAVLPTDDLEFIYSNNPC
jgi:hypothetical protein